MIRRAPLLAALFLCAGCWGQHHNPLAEVNIHASPEAQALVFEATKHFGKQNGFDVDVSNNLARDDRMVTQVLLRRLDGVLVTSSNFMQEKTIETYFFAEKEDADWRAAKEKWLTEVRAALGDEGTIVNVILEKVPEVGKPEER